MPKGHQNQNLQYRGITDWGFNILQEPGLLVINTFLMSISPCICPRLVGMIKEAYREYWRLMEAIKKKKQDILWHGVNFICHLPTLPNDVPNMIFVKEISRLLQALAIKYEFNQPNDSSFQYLRPLGSPEPQTVKSEKSGFCWNCYTGCPKIWSKK